jgi:hypothetical protein
VSAVPIEVQDHHGVEGYVERLLLAQRMSTGRSAILRTTSRLSRSPQTTSVVLAHEWPGVVSTASTPAIWWPPSRCGPEGRAAPFGRATAAAAQSRAGHPCTGMPT